jgi:hypothetical protein
MASSIGRRKVDVDCFTEPMKLRGVGTRWYLELQK